MDSDTVQNQEKAQAPKEDEKDEPAATENLIAVYDKRPEGYDGTCLRPLGLCELGGCCDSCWYRPDHPRFKTQKQ